MRKRRAWPSARPAPRPVLAAVAASVVVAATVSGCGAAPELDDADSTVTILFPSDEWVLAPANETVAKMLVFQPLFEEAEDGSVVGKLARSWEASEDYRTWTYHLRSDARWDDGRPVTARDVAFSLELLMHPEIGYEAPVLDSAVVVSDTTLRLHLSEGIDARFVWAVTYPEHYLASLVADSVTSEAFWYWDFWLRPVGSGPYRYVRHVPKTLVELDANPHFFGGAPKIRRVVLKLSAANPVTELLSGAVDAAGGRPHGAHQAAH